MSIPDYSREKSLNERLYFLCTQAAFNVRNPIDLEIAPQAHQNLRRLSLPKR